MASSSGSFRNQKRRLDESRSDEEPDNNDDTQQQMIKRQSSFLHSSALSAIPHQQLEKIVEPIFRKAVREEVERVVMTRMTRSPSFRIKAPEPPLLLRLVFGKPAFKAPVFTFNRLASDGGSPLQILLPIDPRSDPTTSPFHSGGSIKIQAVALRGEFPAGDRTTWSPEEFNNSILTARNGKRPLITGKLTDTVKPAAEGAEFTDLMFTDNSSWTWSRKFRVGVRLDVEGHSGHYAGLRILEAVSEAFVVRDHRGEPYKKHYPPKLEDEVWRLVKIRKGGPFHNKLSSNGISTVQDLLKMSVVYPDKLTAMLGPKMTASKWKSVKEHAETCEMGHKLYVYNVPNIPSSSSSSLYNIIYNQTSLVLDPVCHLVAAQINGDTFSIQQFSTFLDIDHNQDFIGDLVKEAYSNWNSLQEVDRFLIESAIH